MLTESEKCICVSILGVFPCNTFAPAAVVPQGWPVEAPKPPHSESFISPEAITQPTAGTLLGSLFIT